MKNQKNETFSFPDSRKERIGLRSEIQYLEDYFHYTIGQIIAEVMTIEIPTIKSGERQHHTDILDNLLREIGNIDLQLKESRRKLQQVLFKK